MKRVVFFIVAGLVLLGCARVKVEGSKEPIKLDISMRLDVYQHVEKDIDAIEDIVSGSKDKNSSGDSRSLLNYFVATAYAQEDLSPQVEEAALRRKERRPELISLEEKGVIGENKSGLVEIRLAGSNDSSTEKLVEAENKDRMFIYEQLAQKNASSLEEVQKLYAKRLQENAPVGTPIEVLDEASGVYKWQLKQ